MFEWKDYEENSALFVKGVSGNVAILRHKDFLLKDNETGKTFKIKSSCLDEAKIDSENMIKAYWKHVADRFVYYLN